MKYISTFLLGLFIALTAKAGVITLADPTIFYEDGVYYLTGTLDGSGFIMYSSPDLVHWERCGYATGQRALYKDDVFGDKGFWAPQIFKYDGSYYMAYTANELIAIAKSNDPAGPFKMEQKVELPHNTGQIDPFVFIDDDGTKYMYYVRFDGGNTLYVCELTDDFTSIKDGTVKKCLGAELDWEWRRNYNDGRITEGPSVFKDGEYYYLLYSANTYQDIDYAVGYAYSKSPKGPWTKLDHPFLSRHNIGINGTGHGDLFKDENGQWYYVFHVHASNTQVQTRRTAIVPITVTDDPKNKFIPQPDRMLILEDNASSSAEFPEGEKHFQVDGVNYMTYNGTSKYAQVTFKDAVNFGGYEGEVTIPEIVESDGKTYTVVSVGVDAFYKCPDLKKVTLPSTIQKLDVGAFENCGIQSIELSEKTTSIGYRAFADSKNLLDVVLNRTAVANIAAGTFAEETTKNGKLWVPAGTEEKYKANAQWSAFSQISGLETGTEQFTFIEDGLFYKVSADGAACDVAPKTNKYASYRGPEIIIPAEVEHEGVTYPVTGVAKMAFRDCRLVERIAIPEGIKNLGTYAFSNCWSMKELTLPASLETIDSYCFRGSTGLESVTCKSLVPPAIGARTVFSENVYQGTLYVPAGTREAYATAIAWREFAHIEEMEDTGISEVPEAIPSTSTIAPLYNLQGLRVSDSYKGIVVKDGKKYVKK